jgi:hypothetical protein
VIEETSQVIEIRTKSSPWTYGPPLFGVAVGISTQPNLLGMATALAVFVGLTVWWLTRTQAVRISFDARTATFVYSSLNPFRKHKVVSLAGFSRVYVTPFIRNNGCSIHLSGPRGEHLVLARIPSPRLIPKDLGLNATDLGFPTFHDEHARALCNKIAIGLGITDGGGG